MTAFPLFIQVAAKAASLGLAAVIVLFAAIPLLSVGARIVA